MRISHGCHGQIGTKKKMGPHGKHQLSNKKEFLKSILFIYLFINEIGSPTQKL